MKCTSPAVVFALLAGITTCALATQSTAPAAPQSPRGPADVSVDPRVELVCIIFRLAGNPEYNRCRIASYERDIDEAFGRLHGHPAVVLARKLRETRGMGFDGPMSLAVHLAPGLKPHESLVPLEPLPAGVDTRWTPADAKLFVAEAVRFAEEARFDEFMTAHRGLYDAAVGQVRHTVETHAKLAWFDAFFGARPDAEFHLVLGLLNGGANYGSHAKVQGKEHLYCILGAWRTNRVGTPLFDASILPTVVHEFSHSYANPLIEAHLPELRDAGEKLFARNSAIMRSQAYPTARTVLCESLVRACVARYRFANDGVAAGMAEVAEQVSRGFTWMPELSALLAEYEGHRDRYPTLDSFMPRVVRFFDEYTSGSK